MKKKKFKKIAKLIYDEVGLRNRSIKEKIDYVSFDKSVSEKTKKLILGLISYNEGVYINFSEEDFCISTQDITNIKKKINRNLPYNEDNYLEVCVTKEGFSLNYGFQKRSHYEDSNMYNDLIDILKERVKEINRENFAEIWSKVMQDSGLIRDNNLENLFNE